MNLDPIKPYLHLAEAVAVIGVVLAIWFSGAHHQKGIDDAKYNAERVATLTATNTELARRQKVEDDYAKQLTQANDARDAARAQLARIASAPHPHILCHAAAQSGGSAMPGIPSTPDVGASGSRPLPPNLDFDPSERLYAEVADSSDLTVEACRDFYNRWPH